LHRTHLLRAGFAAISVVTDARGVVVATPPACAHFSFDYRAHGGGARVAFPSHVAFALALVAFTISTAVARAFGDRAVVALPVAEAVAMAGLVTHAVLGALFGAVLLGTVLAAEAVEANALLVYTTPLHAAHVRADFV
jgi:hypothetical protein